MGSCLAPAFTALLSAIFWGVQAKVYQRCELARELRGVHNVPENELAKWLCIANYESRYNTSAHNPASGDHGLFQISELYWCSPPGTGLSCGLSCSDLEDDDIEDDVICARRIYRQHQRISGDGFTAWVVYNLHCKNPARVNSFLDKCFEGENLIKRPNLRINESTSTKFSTNTMTSVSPFTSTTIRHVTKSHGQEKPLTPHTQLSRVSSKPKENRKFLRKFKKDERVYGLPNDGEYTFANVRLEEDTIQWYRFKEIPFPMKFSVNFFTVENPIEIVNGAKPVVQEIGPYVYNEKRTKTIHKIEGDTVTYDELWSFEFDAEASGGRTEDDLINVVNAPLMAVIQNLENLPVPLPVKIENILDDIFENTKVFQKVRVRDYAFGGIKMCDPKRSTTGYSKLVCLAIMMLNQKLLEYHDDLSMSFSLFGYKTKPDGAFTLRRGIKDLDRLGLITSYKGQEYTKFWKGDKSSCDKVEGFYTTYPPFMKKDGSWRVYSTDICKGASLNYVGEREFKKVMGYRYQTDRHSFASDNEDCVCIEATKGLNGENHCFSKGVLDLNTCMGAPVILSFPHLMWADEQYQNSVEGLKSNYTDDYNTIIDFEPNLGLPLSGAIKIQFNLVARPINYGGKVIESTKALSGSLLPILWLKDSFALTDNLIEEVNNDLLSKLSLVDGISWSIIGISIFLILLTSLLFILCKCKGTK